MWKILQEKYWDLEWKLKELKCRVTGHQWTTKTFKYASWKECNYCLKMENME